MSGTGLLALLVGMSGVEFSIGTTTGGRGRVALSLHDGTAGAGGSTGRRI